MLSSVKGLDDNYTVTVSQRMRCTCRCRNHHTVDSRGYSGRRNRLLFEQLCESGAGSGFYLFIVNLDFHND